MKERSTAEKIGKTVRNGGIIAGVIGIVISPELFLAGAGLAVAGEIFSRQFESSKEA